MADPIASIYNYLGNEAQNTRANFSAVQQSLVQARTMQLREQEQLFNQSLDLRKLDILEKQNVFDNVIAMQKLGMAERQMGHGDLLEAAKLESVNALTRYRKAQTTKLEANRVAGENMPYPVGGSPQDYINRDRQRSALGGAVLQTWTGETEENTYLPPDESEMAELPPLTTSGVVDDPAIGYNPGGLPSDTGGGATDAPFGSAGEAAGGLGGMRPYPPINLTPNQKVVAGVAAATAAQTAPKDEFDAFFKAINTDIQEVMNRQDLTQGDKSTLLQQMKADRMRGAMQYANVNPKAKNYLDEIAPERDAVKIAAMRGDEQRVNGIITQNERRLGAFNPVLNKYAAEGYAEAAKIQTAEDAAKAEKIRLDQLKSVRDLITSYGGVDVPPSLLARETQLMNDLFVAPAATAATAGRASADRPR